MKKELDTVGLNFGRHHVSAKTRWKGIGDGDLLQQFPSLSFDVFRDGIIAGYLDQQFSSASQMSRHNLVVLTKGDVSKLRHIQVRIAHSEKGERDI